MDVWSSGSEEGLNLHTISVQNMIKLNNGERSDEWKHSVIFTCLQIKIKHFNNDSQIATNELLGNTALTSEPLWNLYETGYGYGKCCVTYNSGVFFFFFDSKSDAMIWHYDNTLMDFNFWAQTRWLDKVLFGWDKISRHASVKYYYQTVFVTIMSEPRRTSNLHTSVSILCALLHQKGRKYKTRLNPIL